MEEGATTFQDHNHCITLKNFSERIFKKKNCMQVIKISQAQHPASERKEWTEYKQSCI